MQPKPQFQEETAQLEVATDLCATCVHRTDCCLRKNPESSVYDCSEFDDGSVPGGRSAGRLYSVPAARDVPSEAESAPLVGLCMNCDLRHECTLHRSAGGVWHCEEYR